MLSVDTENSKIDDSEDGKNLSVDVDVDLKKTDSEEKVIDTKKWYVLYVSSGHEEKVIDEIKRAAARVGQADKIGEMFVPTEKVVELRGGQKIKSERRIYPGYTMIQLDLDNNIWHLVKKVPHILGFVGGGRGGGKPVPLTEKEVCEMLRKVQDGTKNPKPKVLFSSGEVVRIAEGPFANFDGVVEDVNYEKSKLKVSVLIFGRSTPVELGFEQVQKQ